MTYVALLIPLTLTERPQQDNNNQSWWFILLTLSVVFITTSVTNTICQRALSGHNNINIALFFPKTSARAIDTLTEWFSEEQVQEVTLTKQIL